MGKEVPELYRFLTSFERLTGLPFVLNTSLNTREMPLVEQLQEAFDVLRVSDLDGLVVGRCLIQKKRRHVPTEFLKVAEVCFVPGDEEAHFKLALTYPGLPVIRRHYFGLLREYCDWILTGRKTTTIRYSSSALDLPAESVLEVVARPGGEVVFAVEIKRIRVLPLGSLTYEDARLDGFHSLREFREALGRFYGEVSELHPVTVYEVELMKGFEGLRGRALHPL